MTHDYHIFDRKRVKQHRDRAATSISRSDFLLHAMAERLSDRLGDIARHFPVMLDLGAHHGLLHDYIAGKNGIETIMQSDRSCNMLCGARGLRIVADEEWLPFAANSFDLVLSAGSLHWINDLPGALIQINRSLKPDGLFLAMMPGGESLKELRQSLEQAEIACSGGVSPRISPFIDIRDAGNLLQRAGFAEPVIDSEILTVSYKYSMSLLRDLRNMGESNALISSVKHFTKRSLLFKAMQYYEQHFMDNNGYIPASFEFITLTAWKTRAER